MPKRELDAATEAIAAFNAGDVDAFAALTTPDFEWSPSMVAIEGEVFVGRSGIDSYFASLAEAWETFHIHRDDFREAGNLVVMLGRLEARGKGGGVPVDSSLGMVFTFREGAISRIRGFLTHADALEVAELRE